MGTVTGLLGLGGGTGGTGLQTSSGVSGQQMADSGEGIRNSLKAQQDLLAAIQAQGGLQNQSNVYNQLQAIAQGQGPNPAQAMLAQATGQNVGNQAALMAGQRGAAANPALLARLAAQQGANIQQQAVGQGASMQAQQALNALQASGGLASMMAGNQINQANANAQAQQGNQQTLYGAQNANNAVQGQLANTTMQGQQKTIGGLLGGISGGLAGFADGGEVDNSAQGGPSSFIGKFLGNGATAQAMNMGGEPKGMAKLASKGGHVPGDAKVKGDSLKNDTIPAMLSPKEIVLPRSVTQHKDAPEMAKDFVAAIKAKGHMRGKK